MKLNKTDVHTCSTISDNYKLKARVIYGGLVWQRLSKEMKPKISRDVENIEYQSRKKRMEKKFYHRQRVEATEDQEYEKKCVKLQTKGGRKWRAEGKHSVNDGHGRRFILGEGKGFGFYSTRFSAPLD